jgi:hypothetical protein
VKKFQCLTAFVVYLREIFLITYETNIFHTYFNSCVLSFGQNENLTCPKIKINAPEGMINIDVPISFSVEQNSELQKYKAKYKWEIIGGKLLESQDTSRINTVSNIPGETVKVKVTIQGLPKNCLYTETEFVNILPQGDEIELVEYGKISLQEEFARLDNIMAILMETPKSQAFIILYRKGKQDVVQIKKHIQKLISHMKFRKFPKERITFALNKTDFHSTVVYIVRDGTKTPDCESCKIIKSSDF